MLIPVTEGFTHNKCTICNMYQNVPFRMWTIDEVENYVAGVKARYGRLADSIDRMDETQLLNSIICDEALVSPKELETYTVVF